MFYYPAIKFYFYNNSREKIVPLDCEPHQSFRAAIERARKILEDSSWIELPHNAYSWSPTYCGAARVEKYLVG